MADSSRSEGKERAEAAPQAAEAAGDERLADAIFKAEPLAVVLVDARGRIEEVNPAAIALLEASERSEVVGQEVTIFLDPSYRQAALEGIVGACRGVKAEIELDMLGKKGGRRCLRCHLVPVSEEVDEGTRAVILAHDATEEILARRALVRSEERFRTFFEKNLAASYLCRVDGQLLQCNQAFLDLFGFASREEALATPVWNLFRDPADRESFLTSLREEGSTSLEEAAYLRRDGQLILALENAVGSFDEAGELEEITGFMFDVTELRRKDEILTKMLFNDSLTGLPNRKLLRERLAHELHRQARSGEQIAMIVIGLDRFKTVNQALGHGIGDHLLQQVGHLLVEYLRRSDTVGRLSGDLFAVILPDIEREEDAAAAAGKLLELLNQPFVIEGEEVFSSASIGIALAPSDSSDEDALLKYAELALNRAKEEGGRKYKFFRQQMDVQILERRLLENSLRKAVERGELELHYQAQMNLDEDVMESMEALVRWRHPDMGLVFPGVFIGLAEETGLILQLGEWVLYEACRQLVEWRRESGRDLRVSVNLSPRQFRQRNLVETVEHALESSGLPAGALELEVTESVIMEDVESNIEKLEQLRELGLRLAIDDFGTGYSSLIYLKKNFPVDTLKVDRGFLRDVTKSPDDAAIVEAILAMAHTLRLRIVAEGVETAAQKQFLKDKGCHLGQGFLFGRPLPAEEFSGRHLTR